jgi:hypothetical protein
MTVTVLVALTQAVWVGLGAALAALTIFGLWFGFKIGGG